MTFNLIFIRRSIPRSLLLLAFAFSFLWCPTSMAQVIQQGRFEKEQKNTDRHFNIISMNEKGLAMMRQEEKYENGKHFFELILLDSALQQTWATEIPVNDQLNLVGYEYTQDHLFLLFRKGESDQGDLELIKINAIHHEVATFHIEPKLDFKLSHFIVVGNSALLGGYVVRQPALFLFDMLTSRSKVVPGFFINNTELLDLRANRNNTFNALLTERSSREKKLIVKTFDESGTAILEESQEIDQDKAILTGITSTLERDELILVGTWTQAGSKMALGFYTLVVDPFNKQAITYNDFSELNHFLNYLSLKKAAKLRGKAKHRKDAGKLPNFFLHVNISRLEEGPEGFALLAEVYSPSSNTSPYSNQGFYNPYYSPFGYGYNPYGFSPYSSRYSPYSPYSYGNPVQRTDVTMKNSSVIFFDPTGKVKEDAGFKFKELRLPSLEQASDFSFTAKTVFQLYKHEKDIHLNSSPRGEGDPVQTEAKVQLNNETEVIRNDSDDYGSIRHWYGPYHFIWGYESIKENSSFSSPTHYVFYINKLRVE
jgi:hypothetical protein